MTLEKPRSKASLAERILLLFLFTFCLLLLLFFLQVSLPSTGLAAMTWHLLTGWILLPVTWLRETSLGWLAALSLTGMVLALAFLKIPRFRSRYGLPTLCTLLVLLSGLSFAALGFQFHFLNQVTEPLTVVRYGGRLHSLRHQPYEAIGHLSQWGFEQEPRIDPRNLEQAFMALQSWSKDSYAMKLFNQSDFHFALVSTPETGLIQGVLAWLDAPRGERECATAYLPWEADYKEFQQFKTLNEAHAALAKQHLQITPIP